MRLLPENDSSPAISATGGHFCGWGVWCVLGYAMGARWGASSRSRRFQASPLEKASPFRRRAKASPLETKIRGRDIQAVECFFFSPGVRQLRLRGIGPNC